MFRKSNSTAQNSRRLSARLIRSGTEVKRATWVKHTNRGELRLFAAKDENGDCTAISPAVARA
jgi:hypothetical protein